MIVAGDEIFAGSVCVTAVATPGHRPEHLTFLVSDLSRGPEPWMLLSGDSLLVGDIARPDLAVEARQGAHDLHASMRRLLDLDDYVEVWPAHIGGSLCGGSGLSGKSSSTIGFERRHNPLLGLDEASFVEGLTAELLSRPPNIERIVELNRRSGGDPPPEPRQLTGDDLLSLLGTGATVLDSRVPAEFDTGHVAGSINLPVSSAGVGTRAGWALDPEAPVVIVARDAADAHQMASALQAVGFWNLEGVSIADPEDWRHHSVPVARADSWDLEQLADGLRHHSVDLVDVREPSEWAAGHIPGSLHVPLQPAARGPVDRPAPARPHDRGGLRGRHASGLRRQPPAPGRAYRCGPRVRRRRRRSRRPRPRARPGGLRTPSPTPRPRRQIASPAALPPSTRITAPEMKLACGPAR